MQEFSYTVTVSAPSRGEAERVMIERVGFDEDYGFPYRVNWVSPGIPGMLSASGHPNAGRRQDWENEQATLKWESLSIEEQEALEEMVRRARQ